MKRNGFSLVEMSVVLVAIGIIVLIGLKTSKVIGSAEIRKQILMYPKIAQALVEFESVYPNIRREDSASVRDTGETDSWGATFFSTDNKSRVDIERMIGIKLQSINPEEYVTECYINSSDYLALDPNSNNNLLCINSDHKTRFVYFYCNAEGDIR